MQAIIFSFSDVVPRWFRAFFQQLFVPQRPDLKLSNLDLLHFTNAISFACNRIAKSLSNLLFCLRYLKDHFLPQGY